MKKYHWEITENDDSNGMECNSKAIEFAYTDSFKECMEKAVEFKEKHPDAEWIEGSGYLETDEGIEATGEGFMLETPCVNKVYWGFTFTIIN